MKGEVCKVPIQEENFCKNERKSILEYRTIGFIAGFLLLVAVSLMIVFTLQSLNGISELRQEVDTLKAKMKDLENQISELRSDDTADSKTDKPCITGCDYGNLFNTSYADYDFSKNYDEYEDDDYGEGEDYGDDDSNEAALETHRVIMGEGFTKDIKDTAPARSKRSIIGHNQDGVTLNSESYVDARTKGWAQKRDSASDVTTTPSSYLHPDANQELDQTTSPRNQSKSSRVIYSNDKSKAARKSLRLKSGDLSNSAEQLEVEFTVVGDTQNAPRHRQRRVELDERNFRTGRMRPLPSAHFSGDTSGLILGQHEHFDGNGRLKHPQRRFVNWIERSWVNTLEMYRHYSLADGILTIKESGLYFIYAQIYYLDDHDMNGFTIYRNENEEDPLLQCTTMTHSASKLRKGNTCFTAGVEYLRENDRISLADMSDSRYSIFKPEKSFFGLIKLGDVKIK